MKFYSDVEAHYAVWDAEKCVMLEFINGKYQTEDERIIAFLQKLGYRSDNDGRETIKDDTKGQKTEEKSFAELRAEAKEKGIEGYGRMGKVELMEALKE